MSSQQQPLQRQSRASRSNPDYVFPTPSGVEHVASPGSSLPEAGLRVQPRGGDVPDQIWDASYRSQQPTPFLENNRLNPKTRTVLKRAGGLLPEIFEKRQRHLAVSSPAEDEDALLGISETDEAQPEDGASDPAARVLVDDSSSPPPTFDLSIQGERVGTGGQRGHQDRRRAGDLSSNTGSRDLHSHLLSSNSGRSGARGRADRHRGGAQSLNVGSGHLGDDPLSNSIENRSSDEDLFSGNGEPQDLLVGLLALDRAPARGRGVVPARAESEIVWARGNSIAPRRTFFDEPSRRHEAQSSFINRPSEAQSSSYPEIRFPRVGVPERQINDHSTETEDSDDEAITTEEGLLLEIPRGRMKYELALKYDPSIMVDLAWQHATKMQQQVTVNIDKGMWMQAGYDILMSMPPGYLHAIVAGNLEAELSELEPGEYPVTSDGETWGDQRGKDRPCIYMQSLVGKHDANLGKCPSVDQCSQMIVALRKYVELKSDFVAEAELIDNALRRAGATVTTRIHILARRQRFLCKEKDGDRYPVKGRVEVVKQFCDALEQRLDRVPSELKREPMERPLSYIGYAFNFARRDKQHRSGATNWLMHLVTNTLQYLFPGHCGIMGTPLTYFAAEGEAKCAELLFTLLTDSFALGGKGFNLHDPGVSTISNEMRDRPYGEVMDFWAQRVKFREEMGFYYAAYDRSLMLENFVPKPGPATQQQKLEMHEAELAEAERKLAEKLRNVNLNADACGRDHVRGLERVVEQGGTLTERELEWLESARGRFG